ncbi:MAG: hypothetical protein ACRDN0_01795 [Trebonia sp.]
MVPELVQVGHDVADLHEAAVGMLAGTGKTLIGIGLTRAGGAQRDSGVTPALAPLSRARSPGSPGRGGRSYTPRLKRPT